MPIPHQHQHEHHEMDDQRSLRSTGTDICAKYKRESWLEKKGIYDEVDENAGFGPASGLQRKLKNRHVAMISIGGVIGTGLFLVSRSRTLSFFL
jgi:amino acid permease